MLYPASPSDRYTLTRDGAHVLTGTESECWQYIHQTHSYSVEHAIRHEGYRITPADNAQPAQCWNGHTWNLDDSATCPTCDNARFR